MPKSSVLLQRINPHHQTTIHHRTPKQCTPPAPPHPTPTPIDDDNETFDIPDDIVRYHTQPINPNQSSSIIIKHINAPIDTVWSILRRFDAPHLYKHFLRSCHLISGDGHVGTLRRVQVVSGLPAASSDERLDILDDRRRIISFSVVGGDHRLSNYRSVTSLHVAEEGRTVVLESYVVDTPPGNTKEETCVFVDTIVRCNLQSLAQIAENSVKRDKNLEICGKN
ncbi:abscisic acid receptor PYL4-like [Silene latifolia]|uniref:abscisic acid receptor PYL4-like n=1 Tax=Silene latifolia TaxID=37657 RepID=UPI003D7771B8